MLFLLGFLPAIPFVVCVALWLWSRASGTGWRLARAVGWCTAVSAPAILLQDGLVLFGGSATSFRLLECAKVLPFQIWVLPGGAADTVVWMLAWAALIQTRDAVKPAWRAPVRRVVAAILLVNALAGASWPWWGT